MLSNFLNNRIDHYRKSQCASGINSILNLSSVCLSDVCLLPKVLPGNTHQYLSQIKSKLHETFRISSWGSPVLIINICAHAHARTHTQCVKMCTLLL